MTNGGWHWQECEAATISAFGLVMIFHPWTPHHSVSFSPSNTHICTLPLLPPPSHFQGFFRDTFAPCVILAIYLHIYSWKWWQLIKRGIFFPCVFTSWYILMLAIMWFLILMDLSPYSQSQSLAAQCTQHALQYECRDIQYYYVARELHFNREVQ